MTNDASRLAWDEAVFAALEAEGDLCRSDAQGLADAHTNVLEGAWLSGLSPEATAHLLLDTTLRN
jgi:hypothetical protein